MVAHRADCTTYVSVLLPCSTYTPPLCKIEQPLSIEGVLFVQIALQDRVFLAGSQYVAPQLFQNVVSWLREMNMTFIASL